MKQKSKKLIKSLLLSAIVSLLPSQSDALEITPVNTDNDDADRFNALKTKVWHNVLKVGMNGRVTGVDRHRSHSSHRSHRSSRSGHSSHYSSSHYSSSSSSHYSSSNSYVSTPVKNYKNYSLGDRTLRQGMYGSDVDGLVAKLMRYHYLSDAYSAKKNNYSLYSTEVVQGVKYFQEDAGLPVTGVMDSKTVSMLAKWSPDKSVIRLGIRELSEGDEGNDVLMLIKLLTKAGFQPDPKKVELYNTTYSSDVAMAVKVFQAFYGLNVTGQANYATINKLQKVTK